MSVETEVDWQDLPPIEEPLQLPLEPGQTFLKYHDRCDRAAYLYLKYGVGAGSIELNRGWIFHEVAALILEYAIEHSEPSVPPELGKELLIEVMKANPHRLVSAAERDALRYMVANFCTAEVWDPERIVCVEGSMTLDVGDYTITGHPDRVEDLGGGGLEIVDYKTSWSMPDSDEWKNLSFADDGTPRFAGDFQTMLYGLMGIEGKLDGVPMEGYEYAKLRLAFPRFLFGDQLGAREAVVTRRQLLDFRDDVELQLERLTKVNIGEGKWQPTPGEAACRECPAKFECPLPAMLRPESQHSDLTDTTGLKKAATNWFFMTKSAEALKRRMKKAVIRLADENPEQVALDNGEVGIQIGSDVALILSTTETERLKDKDVQREAIRRAVEYGEDYDEREHYSYSQTTSLDKRKV